MTKILDSIMPLIKPARVKTAAAELGESENKVTAAADMILPSLLAVMLKKGDTPEIEAVLKESARLKIHENYDKIWRGSGIDSHENMGERMENQLLGTNSQKFNTAIAAASGMKREHVDRLTNWVSGTIAAWFSSHLAAGKGYSALLTDLAAEKDGLHKDIPAGILSELGLGHLLGGSAEHRTKRHKSAAKSVAKDAATNVYHPTEPHKKASLGWLWWLLGILALALIAFFCVRSCNARRAAHGVKTAVETTIEVKDVHLAPKFEAIPMVLPDGTKITMYKGHLESAVKAFLDSDKFKNATEADLRSVWFEFTDIEFEHNSATDLRPAAHDLLAGLETMLRSYPNVKMKIGAFADKTGSHAANYAISEARAHNIKAGMEKAGIPAANVSIEGFGKQYANVPVEKSNDERGPDRDIAMRFTK